MNTKWNILVKGFKQYFAFRRFLRLSDIKKDSSLLPDKLVTDIIGLGPVFIKLGKILSTRRTMGRTIRKNRNHSDWRR